MRARETCREIEQNRIQNQSLNIDIYMCSGLEADRHRHSPTHHWGLEHAELGRKREVVGKLGESWEKGIRPGTRR